MVSIIWTAFMLVVLTVLLSLLIKLLLCNCFFLRDEDDDTSPILPSNRRREAFWTEYDRLRTQARSNRQPPPNFEEALTSSTPISYIDLDEPPPTYEDFLKSQTPSPVEEGPLSLSVLNLGRSQIDVKNLGVTTIRDDEISVNITTNAASSPDNPVSPFDDNFIVPAEIRSEIHTVFEEDI